MLRRQPNSLFIGILIGAMLHLGVFPMLHRGADAQPTYRGPDLSITADFPPAPSGIELTEFPAMLSLLDEHDQMMQAFFGIAPRDLRCPPSTNDLLAGTLPGVGNDAELQSGDQIESVFFVRGEQRHLRLNILHALDLGPLDTKTQIKGLTQHAQELIALRNTSARSLFVVVNARTGPLPFEFLLLEDDYSNTLLPLRFLDSNEAVASARIGASLASLNSDHIEAYDAALLHAQVHGIPIEPTEYRTEEWRDYALALESGARIDQLPLGVEFFTLACQCDCDADGFPDSLSPSETEVLCTLFADANDKQDRCRESASNASKSCRNALLAAIGIGLVATCLLANVGFWACLVAGGRLAQSVLVALLARIPACALTNTCMEECDTIRARDESRICTAICLGIPVDQISPEWYDPEYYRCGITDFYPLQIFE